MREHCLHVQDIELCFAQPSVAFWHTCMAQGHSSAAHWNTQTGKAQPQQHVKVWHSAVCSGNVSALQLLRSRKAPCSEPGCPQQHHHSTSEEFNGAGQPASQVAVSST